MSERFRAYSHNHLLIFRGLCSFGVLLSHVFNYLFNNAFGPVPAMKDILAQSSFPFLDSVSYFIPRTGKNFVEVFFILSGYLMGKIFFDFRYSLKLNDLSRFYKNRLLRIAPLLYFSLFIVICIGGKLSSVIDDPTYLIADLFFFNNLTGTNINDVTWSLSYEMQYYIICPFVFFLFSKTNLRTAAILVSIVTGLFSLSIYGRAVGGKLFIVSHYMWLFFGGHSIVIFVRIIQNRYNISRGRLTTLFAYFCFVIAHVVFYVLYNVKWSETTAPFAFNIASVPLFLLSWLALLIVELPKSPGDSERSRAVLPAVGWLLTWGGKISYGVYLWHLPIFISMFGDPKIQAFSGRLLGMLSFVGCRPLELLLFVMFWQMVCFLLTVTLSVITFYLVETRFRPNIYAP